jgi:hypothetical protein
MRRFSPTTAVGNDFGKKGLAELGNSNRSFLADLEADLQGDIVCVHRVVNVGDIFRLKFLGQFVPSVRTAWSAPWGLR